MLLLLWSLVGPRRAPQNPGGARWYGRYFRRPPDPRIRANYQVIGGISDLLLLFALIALVQVAPTAALVLAGLGAIAGGLAVAMRAGYERHVGDVSPRPSDEEMDAALAGHLIEIQRRALTALDLAGDDIVPAGTFWDPVGVLQGMNWLSRRDNSPLIVYSPVVTTRSAIGLDGIWRFTAYEVTVLCPTRCHLAVFHCRQDVLTGKRSDEHTHEFFYRDLVSVQTAAVPGPDLVTDPVDHRPWGWLPLSKPGRRELQFAVPSSDRTVVAVGVTGPTSGAEIRASGIDAATEAVRTLLRATT